MLAGRKLGSFRTMEVAGVCGGIGGGKRAAIRGIGFVLRISVGSWWLVVRSFPACRDLWPRAGGCVARRGGGSAVIGFVFPHQFFVGEAHRRE